VLNIDEQFDDIYARYYLAIVRYAITRGLTKEIAEEISSETFERLWRRRAECNFDSEAALHVWIYKTAGLVMQEQARKPTADADLAACENHLSGTDEIGAREERMQYEHYIAEIEKELSDTERVLFRLILIEKKPYAGCADELGMNPVTMRAIVSRLRKKLRPFITKMLEKT